MGEVKKDICPCCGEAEVGSFEPCPVCDWWNDYAQSDDPDFAEGENGISLNEARAAWEKKKERMKA